MQKLKVIKSTRARECAENVKLSDFIENPDNPSVATDEDIARLAGKLKRVPLGLTAHRIAFVTDRTDGDLKGKRVVLGGNKRLRCLKAAYGEDGEVPSEWFQDITKMSEAERHEFIIDDNVSDGSWDVDKLLAQYGREELPDMMNPEEVEKLLGEIDDDSDDAKDYDAVDRKFDFDKISVVVDCATEDEAEELYNRFTEEGLKCKISTL